MEIITTSINIKTKGNNDIINITDDVQSVIDKNDFVEGNALIFVAGSTAGVTTIEYEPGLRKDYPDFFEKIIPENIRYHHDDTWHDGNGYAHIRASLQGASLIVPFKDRKLLTGTWQQIIIIDFDNRPRSRNIIVQLNGNKE
ncbi:MAG: secondary thiamine-phosphate synthase enzyme YjbQ [Ignavibacterium sp.]